GHAGTSNSGGSSVREQLYPPLGIFMRDDGRHAKGEHGVTTWERSVDGMVYKEIAFTVPLVGPLTSGDQLQRRIHQEGVGQSPNPEDSRFFGVRVTAVQAAYKKDAAQGS